MFLASAVSPNRQRAHERYSKAHKRYLIATYDSEIKGIDPVIKAKVSKIRQKLGPGGWITSYDESKWKTIVNHDYGQDDGEECDVMVDKSETRSQVSKFFMAGWKRKAGL